MVSISQISFNDNSFNDLNETFKPVRWQELQTKLPLPLSWQHNKCTTLSQEIQPIVVSLFEMLQLHTWQHFSSFVSCNNVSSAWELFSCSFLLKDCSADSTSIVPLFNPFTRATNAASTSWSSFPNSCSTYRLAVAVSNTFPLLKLILYILSMIVLIFGVRSDISIGEVCSSVPSLLNCPSLDFEVLDVFKAKSSTKFPSSKFSCCRFFFDILFEFSFSVTFFICCFALFVVNSVAVVNPVAFNLTCFWKVPSTALSVSIAKSFNFLISTAAIPSCLCIFSIALGKGFVLSLNP
mmetsp:Transcript_11994/g.17308  ORF Transcript_11994/g.17308 Transcript_11994/m.17308 type:complete len:294 (-) Transcript_11994:907-1788(-)